MCFSALIKLITVSFTLPQVEVFKAQTLCLLMYECISLL